MSRFGEARFLLSVASLAQLPADAGAEVAFAGRSNSGKSSAINAITRRRGLARTSKLPGRTRLLNFFELAPAKRLVDLPGYGYASVTAVEREAWLPLLDALRERSSLKGLVLVVDSRRGLTQSDEALIEWAARSALQGRQAQPQRSRGGAALGSRTARQPRHGAVVLRAAWHRDPRGTGENFGVAFARVFRF
jgi:GTP-binding protein